MKTPPRSTKAVPFLKSLTPILPPPFRRGEGRDAPPRSLGDLALRRTAAVGGSRAQPQRVERVPRCEFIGNPSHFAHAAAGPCYPPQPRSVLARCHEPCQRNHYATPN